MREYNNNNKKTEKELRECAFRLQWRHSSRFIKCVCFALRERNEKKKEKRLESERGGVVVDEEFFFLFRGGRERRAGYHSSLSPGGLKSFKL